MRVGYNTRPYEKNMEIYQNWSGGLNSVSAPDNMLDSELADILNRDITERGSLKRRTGMVKVRQAGGSVQGFQTGYTQGYFRYVKADSTYDEIFAINGQFYKNNSGAAQPITGLPGGFQNTRPISSVQMGSILYIATGTKLVQYDGSLFSVVDAYLPTTEEMTYIGTNALASDPISHVTDTLGATVASIDYVYPSKPTGVINKYPIVSVYCSKVNTESYEYATQIRKASNSDQTPTDPTTGFKTLAIINGVPNAITVPKATVAGDYEIRVVMRKIGTTQLLSDYRMQYTINKTDTPKKDTPGTNTIHNCNRVLVYGSRLFLYGDTVQQDLVYITQVNMPTYAPSLLTLQFPNPRREGITQILPYRNGLLVFSKTSIQYLTGTSPDDYARRVLHTNLGCISQFGAAVMKNHVAFLSTEGVMALKTTSFTDDKATVEKIDTKVANQVVQDPNAIAWFEDNQYKIIFPSNLTRLRFYQDNGAWVKDYSTKFNFTRMAFFDGATYGIYNGFLYKFDPTVYTDDDYQYQDYFETKAFNMGQPYHPKKLKELHILAAPGGTTMHGVIQAYADEVAITGVDNQYASVNTNGEVVWNIDFEENLTIDSDGTVFGSWVLGQSAFGAINYALTKIRLAGKCNRSHVKFVGNSTGPNHVIGFAYVFKSKRPH